MSLPRTTTRQVPRPAHNSQLSPNCTVASTHITHSPGPALPRSLPGQSSREQQPCRRELQPACSVAADQPVGNIRRMGRYINITTMIKQMTTWVGPAATCKGGSWGRQDEQHGASASAERTDRTKAVRNVKVRREVSGRRGQGGVYGIYPGYMVSK